MLVKDGPGWAEDWSHRQGLPQGRGLAVQGGRRLRPGQVVSVHCTLHTVYSTMHNSHRTRTLYTEHYTLHRIPVEVCHHHPSLSFPHVQDQGPTATPLNTLYSLYSLYTLLPLPLYSGSQVRPGIVLQVPVGMFYISPLFLTLSLVQKSKVKCHNLLESAASTVSQDHLLHDASPSVTVYILIRIQDNHQNTM